MKRMKRTRAFTLLELFVVILVLAGASSLWLCLDRVARREARMIDGKLVWVIRR